MKCRLLILSVILIVGLTGTASCLGKESPAKLKAFVSIVPQKYFVERIGGDRVDVSVLVGPGRSPATYEPTPRQMAELSKARVFFRIGVPFENSLIPKIESMFKGLTMVDTRKGIKLRKMHPDRAGERHETHAAGARDPHIWLDPILVKTQAKTICDALSKLDPKNAGIYKKNLKRFQDNLDRVHARVGKALAPVKGKELFVFHPAYGYLADRYGLKQVAVETGGKEPSARQLATLIDKAKESGARVIFMQPQFDRRNAETVAKAIGGAVVSLDPLGADYLKNLEEMASKVESALSVQR
ncbi:MAG: zinc ABC transporter substrate-binding protein [Deltaproteobacteria bacterium]